MISRRDFLVQVALGSVGLLAARALHAQQSTTPAPAQGTTSNLFDMNQKYADVVPLDEVIAYLDGVAVARDGVAATPSPRVARPSSPGFPSA